MIESDSPQKSQREKFEEAARLAETDDREEVFDGIVKKIALAPRKFAGLDRSGRDRVEGTDE